MVRINIQAIPHKEHRYETVGDYWIDKNKVIQIRVSDMHNWKYELLVAIHELVEQALVLDRNISEKAITQFDIKFEKKRPEGNEDEPGDDPKSPYRKEHFFATNIERQLALELGVDWKKYDKAIFSL